jgi:hypothetical protein
VHQRSQVSNVKIRVSDNEKSSQDGGTNKRFGSNLLVPQAGGFEWRDDVNMTMVKKAY